MASSTSSTSSTSTTAMANGTSTSTKAAIPSKTDPKPIKLRAACNHCFSAKVGFRPIPSLRRIPAEFLCDRCDVMAIKRGVADAVKRSYLASIANPESGKSWASGESVPLTTPSEPSTHHPGLFTTRCRSSRFPHQRPPTLRTTSARDSATHLAGPPISPPIKAFSISMKPPSR